jgi:hypothetical protein
MLQSLPKNNLSIDRAISLYQQHRHSEAIDHLNALHRFMMESSDEPSNLLFKLLAYSHIYLQDNHSALAMIQQCLRSNSPSAEDYHFAACAAYNLGENEQTIPWILEYSVNALLHDTPDLSASFILFKFPLDNLRHYANTLDNSSQLQLFKLLHDDETLSPEHDAWVANEYISALLEKIFHFFMFHQTYENPLCSDLMRSIFTYWQASLRDDENKVVEAYKAQKWNQFFSKQVERPATETSEDYLISQASYPHF